EIGDVGDEADEPHQGVGGPGAGGADDERQRRQHQLSGVGREVAKVVAAMLHVAVTGKSRCWAGAAPPGRRPAAGRPERWSASPDGAAQYTSLRDICNCFADFANRLIELRLQPGPVRPPQSSTRDCVASVTSRIDPVTLERASPAACRAAAATSRRHHGQSAMPRRQAGQRAPPAGRAAGVRTIINYTDLTPETAQRNPRAVIVWAESAEPCGMAFQPYQPPACERFNMLSPIFRPTATSPFRRVRAAALATSV